MTAVMTVMKTMFLDALIRINHGARTTMNMMRMMNTTRMMTTAIHLHLTAAMTTRKNWKSCNKNTLKK